MNIDDAEYLFLDFESERPNEDGGTHIGMFLGWAIRRELADAGLARYKTSLEAGSTTGRDVLFSRCDGKLRAADLGEQGAAFASAWYAQHYVREYSVALKIADDASADELAAAENSAANQACVDAFLDRAFAAWRAGIGLPSCAQLHERALDVLAPRIEAAGFVRSTQPQWSADAQTADFVRTGEGFTQVVRLQAFDHNDRDGRQYGLCLELHAYLKMLGATIYNEGQIDLPQFTSGATPTARLGLSVQAAGWTGPLVRSHRWQGFGVTSAADIEPLLVWLAGRLDSFALPALRRIESTESLAAAFDAVPLSRSVWFISYLDFSVPLCFEMARHPRLDDALAEIERNLLTLPESAVLHRSAMTALIERIRARVTAR